MTLHVMLLELQVRLGLKYRCRCGAIGRPQDREKHERFHQIIREWMQPPTWEEIQQLKKAAAAPPAPQEPTQ